VPRLVAVSVEGFDASIPKHFDRSVLALCSKAGSIVHRNTCLILAGQPFTSR
jgi:hypothetical protein